MGGYKPVLGSYDQLQLHSVKFPAYFSILNEVQFVPNVPLKFLRHSIKTSLQ